MVLAGIHAQDQRLVFALQRVETELNWVIALKMMRVSPVVMRVILFLPWPTCPPKPHLSNSLMQIMLQPTHLHLAPRTPALFRHVVLVHYILLLADTSFVVQAGF